MLYVSNLIKIGPGIQKLIDGIHRHIDSMVISYKAKFISIYLV
jgi:hypothetical protein